MPPKKEIKETTEAIETEATEIVETETTEVVETETTEAVETETTVRNVKQVSFDPIVETIVKPVDLTAETYKFVENVHHNVGKRTAGDAARTIAATQINEAFTKYLEQLKQDFPTIVFDENDPKIVKYSDPRITTYYVLMSQLAQNKALMPTRYKQSNLEFHVSGWPVAPDDTSFAQWGEFTRAAVEAFQTALPTANLAAWAVPTPSKVMDDANVQEQPESSTDILLLSGELVSRQEQQESSTSSLSSLPQDEQKSSKDASLPADELVSEPEPQDLSEVGAVSSNPQAEPQELDNYDFNAWQAPAELTRLRASIKAMHTYGLRLKSASPEKAKVAMQLAIELTHDLKNYYETSPETRNEEVFKTDFHNKLHSQDSLLSTHRHYSKVVIANIAIALTVIGLAAIVVSLLVRGHGFYNSTQGQNKVNDIDQQFDKSLRIT